MKSNYIPNQEDALKTRIRTTGMTDYIYQENKHIFHIYDVGGQRNERRKWIHYFENIDAVVFVAALNHYNAVLFEDNQTNAMLEATELFYEILSNKWFRRSEIILFLNKDDLFRIKLHDECIPLSICFSEESKWPYENEWWNGQDYYYDKNLSIDENNNFFNECYNESIEFIKQIFKNRKQMAIIDNPQAPGITQLKSKQIFQHVTCATNNLAVKQVFIDVQSIAIRANLKKGGLLS